MLLPPREYVENFLQKHAFSKNEILSNVELLLVDARELIYRDYLEAERLMNEELMLNLFASNKVGKSGPMELISSLSAELTEPEKLKLINQAVARTASLAFPYLQQLSTSNTNARRSRAGTTFEALFERALSIYGITFQNQSSLGTGFYTRNNLGKKVDIIVPGHGAYENARMKCAVISLKTTLRERWQQVVEELSRSNVPHIYLATLDESVSKETVDVMKNYNITLVVRNSEKESKFAGFSSVEGFQEFFDETMPRMMSQWPNYSN